MAVKQEENDNKTELVCCHFSTEVVHIQPTQSICEILMVKCDKLQI